MRTLLLLPLVLFAVGGCGDDGDDADDGRGGGGEELVGRTFLSHAVEGQVLVAGTQVRVQFGTDGAVRVSAGCNTLARPLDVDRGRLQAAQVEMTEIGCDPALHAQDQWLAELLGAGPNYVLDGDELLLTAADVTVLLTDEETADPDRPLEGTTWRLDGIIDGEVASSAPNPATVVFADGQVTLTNEGCNGGTGPATIHDDGTIEVGSIVGTLLGCTPEATAVADAFARVLDGTVTATVRAGSLTLTHPSGAGLTFRAD